jgi:hypothetical protein
MLSVITTTAATTTVLFVLIVAEQTTVHGTTTWESSIDIRYYSLEVALLGDTVLWNVYLAAPSSFISIAWL